MGQGSSWWRKLGTALAALVLTLLTFGPSLDGLICKDEGAGLSAAASEAPTVTASHQDLSGQKNDPAGPCMHGHCHHGSQYVAAVPQLDVTPEPPVGEVHPLSSDRVPTSDPKFGLKRPPRG